MQSLAGVQSGAQRRKVVCPPLHHLDALRKVFGAVVGGPDIVPLLVSQLFLDYVLAKAVLALFPGFVQDR